MPNLSAYSAYALNGSASFLASASTFAPGTAVLTAARMYSALALESLRLANSMKGTCTTLKPAASSRPERAAAGPSSCEAHHATRIIITGRHRWAKTDR